MKLTEHGIDLILCNVNSFLKSRSVSLGSFKLTFEIYSERSSAGFFEFCLIVWFVNQNGKYLCTRTYKDLSKFFDDFRCAFSDDEFEHLSNQLNSLFS